MTLSSPGIAADSNGLFHGAGRPRGKFVFGGRPADHGSAEQSLLQPDPAGFDPVDGSDLRRAPAEYGEKTSVVINVTTRSGQGMTTPTRQRHGFLWQFRNIQRWRSISATEERSGETSFRSSGLNSGRFLDPPEFIVMHDKGNEENLFDRVDYQVSKADSIHLNLGFTRSWFQTPNSFDAQNATAWNGLVVDNGGLVPTAMPVGPTDQRSQIKTFNIAPSWTRLISNNYRVHAGRLSSGETSTTTTPAPIRSPISRPDFRQETVGQDRTLTNAGLRSDISYVKGIHNMKVGATYQQTFLDENDRFGIVDPTFLPSLTDANGNMPASAISESPWRLPCYNSAPFDLTRGGSAVSVPRPHRREAARSLCPGHDHQRKLVVQSWPARRFLQRPDHPPGS